MAYRHGAQFIADPRPFCRPLDRNARARVIALAEALERRTKPAGRRNGIVSLIGLVVLRALLFRYLNSKTGLLCPSYATLQAATGLCRQSIATALARLEMCGVLKITRRLCRQHVSRTSPITGLDETIVTTTNATSLYAVHEPGAWADHLARPPAKPAPFPARRQLDMLQRMASTWKAGLKLSEPGLAGREEPRSGLAKSQPCCRGLGMKLERR